MKSSIIEEGVYGMSSTSLDTARYSDTTVTRDIEDVSATAVPSHPLGVRPSGNQYLSNSNVRHAIGFFQILPDEFILTLLEYLDARLLQSLGYTCKALFAFCASDDLWKALFIECVSLIS